MEIKESLTNEKLLKKFKSQFELVNYAIKLAENMISTGRDTRIKTDNQNRALQIIGEIEQNKDHFDSIEIEVAVEEKVEVNNFSHDHGSSPKKFSEGRKRMREAKK